MASDEYLDIDGTIIPVSASQHLCPAWVAKSLLPLWQGADLKGSDLDIPHGSALAFPRRKAISKRTLLLVIFGDFDPTGAAIADVREGIEANIGRFQSSVADPATTADTTRTATLHLPSGATRTGAVHVEDFQLGERSPESVLATLDLTIPAGALS